MKKKIYTTEKINEFATQIENGELEETKEILILQNKEGDSVAHYLAWNSDETKWTAADPDILRLQNSDRNSIAHFLAKYHPTWITENIEILSLANNWGKTVEDILIEKRKI